MFLTGAPPRPPMGTEKIHESLVYVFLFTAFITELQNCHVSDAGDESLPCLLAEEKREKLKDFRQDVIFQACACAPKAKLGAQTVLFLVVTQWHLFWRSVSSGGEEQIRN